ncbi:hypothetical protein [Erysipelothrix piscisicarius]|uniref:hypothetical protein n=1 Tax=Erysipelothrix piscisicarius TaxID=2485784 RepID=UPI002F955734
MIYDAANVRYYAEQNIKITKQLIQDIEVLTQTTLENPIYRQKIKEVKIDCCKVLHRIHFEQVTHHDFPFQQYPLYP